MRPKTKILASALAVLATAGLAGQASAQLRSETRRYLNSYCLSNPIYFWRGNLYYQRLGYGSSARYRTINFNQVRLDTVRYSGGAMRFECRSNCRWTMDRLGGPGRIYTTVAILPARSMTSSQARRCVRAIRHMAGESGARRGPNRDMF